MAEAFPDDDSRRTISVLLLGTKWQFDTYGLSTINKSLVNNLRLVDPEGKTIKITCAVVEDDGKIKNEDFTDARTYGVELKGAKRPRGSKRGEKPELQWLDKSPGAYYRHLQDDTYDFIIGHAPYLANGCLNLRELYNVKNESPKTILMFHGLPKDENGDVDDDVLCDWLNESDIVFSVGKTVEDELLASIAALDPDKKPIHKIYLPSYPLELFNVKQDKVDPKVRGTQNVSMMSGEIKHLDVSGLDFPLAVTAAAAASDHVQFNDGVKIKLTLLTVNEEESVKWKEHFGEILCKRNLSETGLSFQLKALQNLDKMKVHMRKCNLFLLPLKQDSPLFGTEALPAVAAGVPVLISNASGLASLLDALIEGEPIVGKNKLKVNAESWKERIIQKLVRPVESQKTAKRLREQFLLDTSIAQTHIDFINSVADSACIQLEMDIETDPVVSDEQKKAAIKFGIESSDLVDAKKYIIAFMKRLLLHREKVERNLLTTQLNSVLTKLWQDMLSSLEERNRKLINIKSGSLIFTLFCPTKYSVLQIEDEKWKVELQGKVNELLQALGGKAKSRIRTMESVVEHRMLQKWHKLKTTDSDKRSLGYETMMTLSDTGSVHVLQTASKVDHWLSQQHDLGEHDQALKLLKTWTLDHVITEEKKVTLGNRFSISESGGIGISCFEKPSLSVMYPDTDKATVVLSNKTMHYSATFMKVRGKEYLATACNEDGCLYLWDIESKKSWKGFDPKLPREQRYKDMNIFKISDTTIGYGEWNASPDGSRRVFILKTDTDELTLYSTLRLVTTQGISEICYTEVDGGTPCLLLCIPYHRIIAVEMVGGKTRWEVGKEQMGEKFDPWSICIDNSGTTVYVTDYRENRIHLLSAEDGSVITSIDALHYRIGNLIAVRFHDDHLYVEHYTTPGYKYAINKFKRET